MRLGTWFRVACVLIAFVVLLLLAVYRAAVHEPEFYQAEVAVPVAAQETASNEFLAQTTAVETAVRQSGAWSLTLTQDQINGFLAVDLPRNHAQLLPKFLSDPRVQLQARELTLACRVRQGALKGVATLKCDVYLAEPRVLAVRIKQFRAGVLPMPLESLLDQLLQLAHEHDVPLRRSNIAGDPLLLLEIKPVQLPDGALQELKHVEIRDGAVFISGSAAP